MTKERQNPFIDSNRTDEFNRYKKVFWWIIKDCLVNIHEMPRNEAQKRTNDLRRKIESPPRGIYSDIIYHDEPFYVACNLASQDLSIEENSEKYIKILAQRRVKW